MGGELSILRLVLDASLIVQIVLGLLLGASLMSWAIILKKRGVIHGARAEAERFEEQFWVGGGDLTALYREVDARAGVTGMASIFAMGFREFARLRQQGSVAPEQMLEGARRAMKVAQLKEIERLEQSLATLATVGSISPYVGLFGTVWGIMNAFVSLGSVQQATLAMVAPGIAEALVATAMGLFAAIPAVIAYNRFTHDIDRLASRYDIFMEEFSNILQQEMGRA